MHFTHDTDACGSAPLDNHHSTYGGVPRPLSVRLSHVDTTGAIEGAGAGTEENVAFACGSARKRSGGVPRSPRVELYVMVHRVRGDACFALSLKDTTPMILKYRRVCGIDNDVVSLARESDLESEPL
ncbi:MAG: hypothetical protein QHG99_00170 [Methanomicrobiales archaeon]|nr:hypothetical protein [Methanomicrobiales archaeon]